MIGRRPDGTTLGPQPPGSGEGVHRVPSGRREALRWSQRLDRFYDRRLRTHWAWVRHGATANEDQALIAAIRHMAALDLPAGTAGTLWEAGYREGERAMARQIVTLIRNRPALRNRWRAMAAAQRKEGHRG